MRRLDQHVKAAQEIAEAPTPELRCHLAAASDPFTNPFLSELAKRISSSILLPGG